MKQKYIPWHPDRPPSTGAVAYHTAVANASWHKDNIGELIRLVKKGIRKSDLVVDFGAGTGSSALYILRNIPSKFSLVLVDNSPSWLGNAHSLLHRNPRVTCLLLVKIQDRYQSLDELMGKETVHHVVSANTVHLIPDVGKTFKGIFQTLKAGGSFTFQSGNISRRGRDKGILMIDDSIHRVHDLSISIIKTDKRYAKYKKDINVRMQRERAQRKFVFPEPRTIDEYVNLLKHTGFRNIHTTHKHITVSYKDWLSFLRVKRLQAGILPEVGGKESTPTEQNDRDEIITRASRLLFKDLEVHNVLASHTSFTTEWVYVQASK